MKMQVTTIEPDGSRTVEYVEIDMDKIEREREERLEERKRNVQPPKHYAALDDWDLIVACLHYEGGITHLVSDEIQWEAYCAADGFGWLAPEALEDINDGWDWSHIRDSSPAGKARIAYFLRSKLRSIFNL